MARRLDGEFTRHVPAGSPRRDVEIFLTGRRIESHYDERQRIMTASIPDAERGGLTRFGVYMTFNFDENGRLAKHKIEALGTGP